MKKKQINDYYLGLDIGTNSVGYAATDMDYSLLKYKGKHMWGSHLFEEANESADRRKYRTTRRRLERRKQRAELIREIFASEISKIDPDFFKRLEKSAATDDDAKVEKGMFNDPAFNDKKYHEQYPTIHHLIMDLINNSEPHDVRLVYLACEWLVTHRGHFLFDVSETNIDALIDFNAVYNDFMDCFDGEKPWNTIDPQALCTILKERGVTNKNKKAIDLLYKGVDKKDLKEFHEELVCRRDLLVKFICGGEVKLSSLFDNDDYTDKKCSLSTKEDEFIAILSAMKEEDARLLEKIKAMSDCVLLQNILNGHTYISETKIEIYNKHKKDLDLLKGERLIDEEGKTIRRKEGLVKKYIPDKYDVIFRKTDSLYTVYSGNFKSVAEGKKNTSQKDFCDALKKFFKGVVPEPQDQEMFDDMMKQLENGEFMPKQVSSDNRVIPYQVYFIELKAILDNAEKYLPFINEKDADGYTEKEKILSVFKFRIPYFVGPLNSKSEFAWLKRKAEGKILPWNFDEKVDLEDSEQEFISRMTNTCTYLPGEDVLPKQSLLYEKFEVLNGINAMGILPDKEKRKGQYKHGITVEQKQQIYEDLFLAGNNKRVTKKAVLDFLKSKCEIEVDDEKFIGIDGVDGMKATLAATKVFKNMLESKVLTAYEAEEIILQSTCTESASRFAKWLDKSYPNLSENDRKRLKSLKCKDFGRLSKKLLCGIEGANRETGEIHTVIEWMWNYNYTLSELLMSEDFDFQDKIKEFREDYYREHPKSFDKRLDELYVSNSVKRSIYRTFDVVNDVVKACGGVAPKKIFVETTRTNKKENKGQRTKSRYAQLLELYDLVDTEDARLLKEEIDRSCGGDYHFKELKEGLKKMGDMGESKLQSDKLFLYYIQFGRCMYSGKPIELIDLYGKDANNHDIVDIDHIYPQTAVKDDSIINNKVLVYSKFNAEKADKYPISDCIRTNMTPFWKYLNQISLSDKLKLVSDEKYYRLTRATAFTDDERWGFINRQLVETSQAIKVVATLLKEKYPDTIIEYPKGELVSAFRHQYGMLKARDLNDMHHAKDAYLNVVVGNIYRTTFISKQDFLKELSKYSAKLQWIFGDRELKTDGSNCKTGRDVVERIKKVMKKNTPICTAYAFCRKGGYFDQNPLKARAGLIPLKKDMNPEKYGGYNGPTVSFFVLAQYTCKNKKDLMLVPIRLLDVKEFELGEESAMNVIKRSIESVCGNKKTITVTGLPLGMRKIKIRTMFELDGFRLILLGKGATDRISFSPMMPLLLSRKEENYINHLSNFCKKIQEKPDWKYSKDNCAVDYDTNCELFMKLVSKSEMSFCLKLNHVRVT